MILRNAMPLESEKALERDRQSRRVKKLRRNGKTLRLLSDLVDDSACARKTDGALRIINAALGDSEATSAGATFRVELVHCFEAPLRRQTSQIDSGNTRHLCGIFEFH